MTETLTGAIASELVWDVAARATASAEGAEPLRIAGLHGWSPEGLLAAAAAASVMTRFLALAASAHLEVLGYVSNEHASPGGPGCGPQIDLAPCIVVSSDDDAARARALFAAALDEADVSRALRQPLRADVRVSVVAARPATVPSRRRVTV